MPHSLSSQLRRRTRKTLQLESLETRNLLATIFVNDNWSLDNDLGAAGLSTGDEVANDLDGGSSTGVYGTTAFGTVVTATDDFDDGNDSANPAWARFDPFGAAAPATFSFPNGEYRIQAANSPNPGAFGAGRAGSFLPDIVHDFEVSVDVANYGLGLDQTFGLVARATSVGAGTTDGYLLAFDTPGTDLNIVAIDGEVPTTLAFVDVGELTINRDYKLVFRGVGQSLTGEIYESPNFATPLRTISVDNGLHSQGQTGLFTSVFTGDGVGTSDVTFDDMSVATSLPNTGSISDAVAAAAANDSLVILDGSYAGASNVNQALDVQIGEGVGAITVESLTLNANASLAFDLQGLTAAEYDVITATNGIALNGATLRLNRGVAAPPNTNFVVIENDGNSPVVGTFDGIPEGGSIIVDGQPYTISYAGGDGNDVVITAHAATEVVSALKDNTIFSEGELSNGEGVHIFSGRTANTNANRRALIAFDFTTIPQNSLVVSSNVKLTMNKTISGSQTVGFFKSSSEWGESTSDATGNEGRGVAAAIGDATWTHRAFDTDTWNSPGGDFAAIPSATASVVGNGDYNWNGFGMINDVQSWVNGAANTGWFVVGNETASGTAKRFHSRESGNANGRPVLTVEFVPPVVTPTIANVGINTDKIDPPDLATPQPTSWAQQRSDLRSVVVEFSEAMAPITPADIVLTNLGINAPVDADTIIPVTAGQLSQNGNDLTISFPRESLPEGAYSLEILPTATNVGGLPLDGNGDGTTGDSFLLVANGINNFHKMTFNFSGDDGVSVFDFTTFAYWFGESIEPIGSAPEYADVSDDDGVSVFDFTAFSDNFGKGITLPVAFASHLIGGPADPVESTSLDSFGETEQLAAVAPLERWELQRPARRAPLELASATDEISDVLDVLAEDIAGAFI
jgi:hypothetical protein